MSGNSDEIKFRSFGAILAVSDLRWIRSRIPLRKEERIRRPHEWTNSPGGHLVFLRVLTREDVWVDTLPSCAATTNSNQRQLRRACGFARGLYPSCSVDIPPKNIRLRRPTTAFTRHGSRPLSCTAQCIPAPLPLLCHAPHASTLAAPARIPALLTSHNCTPHFPLGSTGTHASRSRCNRITPPPASPTVIASRRRQPTLPQACPAV